MHWCVSMQLAYPHLSNIMKSVRHELDGDIYGIVVCERPSWYCAHVPVAKPASVLTGMSPKTTMIELSTALHSQPCLLTLRYRGNCWQSWKEQSL